MIISSLKSQINFDSVSKYEGSKEPMEKPLTLDEVKKQNQKQKINLYEYFSTMAKNSTTMLQQFVEIHALLKNMDAQIKCFINKL